MVLAPPCCERSPGEPGGKQLPSTVPQGAGASSLPVALPPLCSLCGAEGTFDFKSSWG